MLYNYPKQNIDELFNLFKIDNAEYKARRGSEIGQSFQLVMSQANFMKN